MAARPVNMRVPKGRKVGKRERVAQHGRQQVRVVAATTTTIIGSVYGIHTRARAHTHTHACVHVHMHCYQECPGTIGYTAKRVDERYTAVSGCA